MEEHETLSERLAEIQQRIAELIAVGDRTTANEIYKNEYLAAQEAAEKLWECR
jgi:uncharacterized small protein (DUF1192 family)